MADKITNTVGTTGSDAPERSDGAAEAAEPLGIKGLAATMAGAAASLRAPRIKSGDKSGQRGADNREGSAADKVTAPTISAPGATPGKDAASAAAAPTDHAAEPEPATEQAVDKTKAAAAATAQPPPLTGKGSAGLIGRLDADQRIRQTAERHERILWAGAAGATLVYALLIWGQMAGLAILISPELMQQQEQERRRRGQDAPDSISVEIVPEPDLKAKTTHWREGTNVPAQQPMEQPPQQPQQEARAEPEPEPQPQPEPAKEEPTKEKADEPRDAEQRMLLDIDSLVDAAAQDLKRQIDDHYDKKKQMREQRRQQAAAPSGAMQIRGTGASGKSDPFTRSVLAALMKTRPGPFALWGRVLVSFQISETGRLLYVHVLQSSGNSALDEAAVDAIRRAQFKKPPPELSPNDRTYIIDYIFG